LVVVVTALAGILTTVAGVWSFSATRSFAEFAGFPQHEHFLHDIGAFQIGIGVLLLLALIWSDALLTVLAGFFVANTLHTVNHITDLHLGGHAWHAWGLGAVSLFVALAFLARFREGGYVVGAVATVANPLLAPFVRQKTVSLTTYRKNGEPGRTPVSTADPSACARPPSWASRMAMG
jgi:hypothetical protein